MCDCERRRFCLSLVIPAKAGIQGFTWVRHEVCAICRIHTMFERSTMQMRIRFGGVRGIARHAPVRKCADVPAGWCVGTGRFDRKDRGAIGVLARSRLASLLQGVIGHRDAGRIRLRPQRKRRPMAAVFGSAAMPAKLSGTACRRVRPSCPSCRASGPSCRRRKACSSSFPSADTASSAC